MTSVSLVDGHIDGMTDEQIIKALEYCINNNGCNGCEFTGHISISECMKEFHGVITRQKAEIERLEYVLMGVMHSVDKWLEGDELKQDEVNRAATMREKTLQMLEDSQDGHIRTIADKDVEIEKLERANIQLMAILQTAQSEAIKEFVGKLKEASYIPNMSLTGEYVVDVSDIDNLLKEKDGEQNE